jgi:hypothetical protein
MVSLVRRIAGLRSQTRRLELAVSLLALVLALVLLGLPALADSPTGADSECSVTTSEGTPAETTPLLYELITAPVVDTYIDQYDGAANVDHSGETKLKLRTADQGVADILLQFDLGGIPPDAIIESVELELHAVYARPKLGPGNAPGVALYRPLKQWCASADWTRYCESNTWCQPGAAGVDGACAADQDRAPEFVTAQIALDGALYKLKVQAAGFDMLAQWVQAWVSGEAQNDGLLLALAEPVQDVQHIDFAGSGYFGYPEASAPILKVVYSLPILPGDISGVVWLDKNGNGIRETALGEAPIADSLVKLSKSDGTILRETHTNKCGEYLFAQIAPDDYQVWFELREGYLFSPKDAGTDDTIDSDANPGTWKTDPITLAPGAQITMVNAGMYKEGALLWIPIVGNRATYWP